MGRWFFSDYRVYRLYVIVISADGAINYPEGSLAACYPKPE